MMEVNGRISASNEKGPSENSHDEQKKPVENSTSSSAVVNLVEWDESRRNWIGDLSQRPQRVPTDPILSWSMTYDDLLSTYDDSRPFS